MTLLIAGASGAGKTTLAKHLQELIPECRLVQLDKTGAWQTYRQEYGQLWDTDACFDEEHAKIRFQVCWRAVAEGLSAALGSVALIEGAQMLPHLDKLRNHVVLLVDPPKEVCIAQLVKRKAAKLLQPGHNAWLNAAFNLSRRIYELWEPHIQAARQMKHVHCILPEEVDKALDLLEVAAL